MDPLEVNPDQMKTSAAQFTDMRDVARSISEGVSNGINLLGDFGGDDKVGVAFKEIFNPSVQGLVDSTTGIGVNLDEKIGQNLKNSADLFQKSDQVNAESVPSKLP
jgi:hypothetical protein